MRRIARQIVRLWVRLTSSTCQSFGATIYTSYRGTRIPMVPIADPEDAEIIIDWVPDPNWVKLIDAEISKSEKDEREARITERAETRVLEREIENRRKSEARPGSEEDHPSPSDGESAEDADVAPKEDEFDPIELGL